MSKMSDAYSKVVSMTDEAIDTTENPEPTAEMLKHAEVWLPKVQAETVIVNSIVLDWFKAQGDDYQLRINQILHEHMLEQQRRRGG